MHRPTCILCQYHFICALANLAASNECVDIDRW